MHRGDWSMGVLDRYFKFGEAGDRYCRGPELQPRSDRGGAYQVERKIKSLEFQT